MLDLILDMPNIDMDLKEILQPVRRIVHKKSTSYPKGMISKRTNAT